MRSRLPLVAFVVLAVSAQGCAGSANRTASPLVPATAGEHLSPDRAVIGKYIKHVVIIVQENRSLTNFFAGYPGVTDAPLYGYQFDPNTQTRKKIALTPVTFKGADINHS